MKIKYLGPAKAINVGVDGDVRVHVKGKVLEYPKEVGDDLLLDKKNDFEGVKGVSAEKTASKKANGKKP
jgi:hypothetical protein